MPAYYSIVLEFLIIKIFDGFNTLVHSVSTGIDLGKAYDIPPNLKSEQFYAAVVLKVSLSQFFPTSLLTLYPFTA